MIESLITRLSASVGGGGTLLAVAVVLLAALYAALQYFNNPAARAGLKTLPGPRGLPIVGYLPFLTSYPYIKFTELARVYGDVFQVRVGTRTIVVLNGRELMHEALSKDAALAGRPVNTPTLKTFVEQGPALFGFQTGNARWKFTRKQAVKALGLFASSRNSRLEKLVTEALESMHMDIREHLGVPWNPRKTTFECIAGIIGSLNFGTQFNRDNEVLQSAISITEKIGQVIQVGSFVDYLPFGSIFFRGRLDKAVLAIQPLFKFILQQIDTHECNEKISDIADALHRASQEVDEEELRSFGMKASDVKYISQNLFAAGFATIFESFRWLLNLMAKFPHVQRKVQEELDKVLEERRSPSLYDRERLPYTEATITESFRFVTLVPLSLPHSIMSDTSLNGYYLPKDALLFPNIWGVHHDEKIFPNSYSFKPERFISSTDGEERFNTDLAQFVIPFSVGKRRCVGENLARQELFLLFASTMQNFSVKAAPGVEVDVDHAGAGFNRRANDADLIFSERDV